MLPALGVAGISGILSLGKSFFGNQDAKKAAKEAQRMAAPLARLIYNFGEPGCSAHQRMKIALWLLWL